MMAGHKSERPAATGRNAVNQITENAFQHNARIAPLARFEQRQTVLHALQQRPHHGLELRKLGIKSPARRVADLVLQGHSIDSAPACIVTDTGAILSTVVYRLGVNHG